MMSLVASRVNRRDGEEKPLNPFDLTGKVAVVTGGNGGLGLAMALGLAQAGAKIAVIGRKPEKTAAAAARIADETGVETVGVVADVSAEADVERAAAEIIARFGSIDILINNAGINIRRTPENATLDDWQAVMDANVTSVYLMSKAVVPIMRKAGGGKIVNIGSMASIFGANFAAPYATSKGAVVQLTKSQALAWAKDRIQVNVILPGWFDTELTQKARIEVPGMHEKVEARIPFGRWGVPAEIAGTAVWLASPASDYVTGAAIPVDGGYTAQI